MPTISLRLTDEEHAALKEWAHGSRRSMQREAVYRIFVDRQETYTVRNEGNVPIAKVHTGPAQDPHFKPDFK